MCGAAQDLYRCMANLMLFEEENVLKIPLLESADDKPKAPPTPAEEAILLDNPQEALATAACQIRCEEQAPKPEGTTGLGVGNNGVPRFMKVTAGAAGIQTTTNRA